MENKLKKIQVFYEGDWHLASMRAVNGHQVFAAMDRDNIYRIFNLWRPLLNGDSANKR